MTAPADLRAKFAQYERVRGPRCMVAVALNELTGHVRRDFLEGLADELISSAALTRFIKEEGNGLNIGRTSIERHRRQECSCDRRA